MLVVHVWMGEKLIVLLFDEDFPPKPLIPKEQAKGEIDVWNPHQLQSLQMMFIRNARRTKIEENATLPSDAINSALAEFNYGQNDTTEQKELLQLPSDGD